jgi:uncharacterized membrane protein YedE/YeeE
MADSTIAVKRETSFGLPMPRQYIVATLVLVGSLVMAYAMSKTDPLLAPLWLLGMGAGFTLQRSRFCFASAFRDLFLFGSARTMKGIIIGLAVATAGFAILMYSEIPFPQFGALPAEANILPVGMSTIVGGGMFGLGMVLSGGCVSGSLYRMAEGYVASWVSIAGVVIGLGFLTQTWNWWWRNVVSNEPRIWLPGEFNLGFGGAVALTFVGLAAVFFLITWWEARNGLSMPDLGGEEELDETFSQKLSVIWKRVFIRGWSAPIGGAVLGGIAVLMYATHMPWGTTGELMRFSNLTMTTLNVPPPELLGLSDIGGCAGRSTESGLFGHTFAVTVGLLPGSLVAALFAKEFKVRFPRTPTRYFQALGGGVLMGYGSGLAIGCTIGAFFSSIPSLSVSGWLFGLAIAGGAAVGVQVIKRIP